MLQTPVKPGASTHTVLSNVTWTALEKLDTALQGTGARLVYLDGLLEIMAPLSEAHEEPKKRLAQLLEVYMRSRQIRFYARGSATLGMTDLGARQEPDESYCIGQTRPVPDLAIEITVTSGGIDSLDIYQRLGVPEVWFWEEGVILVYVLGSEGYRLSRHSALLPNLDIRSIEFHLRMDDQFDAINSFISDIGKGV